MTKTNLSTKELQELRAYIEHETHYVVGLVEVEDELERSRRRSQRNQQPANFIDRAIRKWLKAHDAFRNA